MAMSVKRISELVDKGIITVKDSKKRLPVNFTENPLTEYHWYSMNIDFLLTIGMLIGFWSFVIFAYRWWF